MESFGIYMGEAAIGLLVTYVIKVVNDVRIEVRTVNGRLRTMEEWRTGSTKQGDERQANTERRLEKLER